MKVVRFSDAKIADAECHAIFDQAYEACPRIVDFNQEWVTPMGFFDNAISGEHALKIKPGRMLRTVVPTSGRRALFIGTHLGVVAVYERLTGNDQLCRRSIYYQSTRDFAEAGWVSKDQPDDWELDLLLGDETTPNIGLRIERLVSYVNQKDRKESAVVSADYTPYHNVNKTIPKVKADQSENKPHPKVVKSVNRIKNVVGKLGDVSMTIPDTFAKGTYLGMGKYREGARCAA